jgi:uncharacterized membrane protein
MVHALSQAAAVWTAWYADSPVLRTTLNFTHIGALVIGGGAAIVEDRAMLAALRQDEMARRRRVDAQQGAHRVVILGLTLAVASGVMMFAADWDTYSYSRVFWTKMVLVVLLVANGALLTRAERAAVRGEVSAWARLRRGALTSLALWALTTLAGAALPNVG